MIISYIRHKREILFRFYSSTHAQKTMRSITCCFYDLIMNGFVWSTNFCVFFFVSHYLFFHFLHKQNVLKPILHNAQSSTSTLVLFDVRILNLNSPYLNDDFPFLRLKIDVWLSKRFIAV